MNNYLFVSKRRNIREYIRCNFNTCLFIHAIPYGYEINKIIRQVKKNKFEQVILEDYIIGIKKIIKKLKKLNIKIKMVWTNSLATLNSDIELGNLLEIVELLKNKEIDGIAFTDDGLYEMYKEIPGVSRIKYTVSTGNIINAKPTNKIGIYGNDIDWRSNYYNQIASVKMVEDYILNLIKPNRITKNYCKLFNIVYSKSNAKLSAASFRENIKENSVNSMVEFSNKMNLYIIDSYNNGIPCVVGNNTQFFNGTKLEEYVVVRSDDDINEIADKMNLCIKNRDKIVKIYNDLKKDYDKDSKSLVYAFIKE